MSGVLASAVPVEHVQGIWPAVEDYIRDAARYTYGRFEADDVLAGVLNGDFNLWIAFEGRDILGTVVTHIVQYPRARYLACPFVAGRTFSKWKLPMLRLLQHWAADNDCQGLESSARLGWARVFKDDGYQALWQTFQLPAAPAGLGAKDG